MNQDTSGMTQNAIMERDLTVQSKIRTVIFFTKEYEKHHHDVIMIGDQKTIESLVYSFKEIMEIQSVLDVVV